MLDRSKSGMKDFDFFLPPEWSDHTNRQSGQVKPGGGGEAETLCGKTTVAM
jgi:hypothetical protein